ncbi:NAD(P)-dependent alcohol dehydrogenase [Pseudozobellia thermophila]|uniref:NADPH:quinone reductase n=1 Tax=Pseudozobellia thermophila TaxID=192903 RepID=A0A1M6PNB0_9FLAO|nr:NAD(P)-dependent alcohol dehydrogenase [Pseudozobellia thermophila]SHK09446.1 NADPH:quinone reductase [Pseudozobellia thermophila]
MKAVIYTKYGSPDVLKLVDIAKPEPKDNEILVKICSTTVTSGDVRLRSSNFPPLVWLPVRLIFGLFKPKKEILGHEFSGIVEAIGKDVTKFEIGDEIFATPTMLNTGSYTEYICIPQERKKGVLGLKPKNLSFKEAAAIPVGGMTALFLLNKAKLGKGQHILIFGASGSVGSYAIQIAKEQEATVVAVCSSSNFEMVKSLGADSAIDYKKEDYSLSEDKFDIIFDAVGKTSKSRAKKVLKQGGSFISVKSLTSPKQEHLDKLKELTEKGKVKPYIDKCFPLSEIIAAHEYVDKGRKKGNVVIEIISSTNTQQCIL